MKSKNVLDRIIVLYNTDATTTLNTPTLASPPWAPLKNVILTLLNINQFIYDPNRNVHIFLETLSENVADCFGER